MLQVGGGKTFVLIYVEMNLLDLCELALVAPIAHYYLIHIMVSPLSFPPSKG